MISARREKKKEILYFTRTKDIAVLKFYIFNVETYTSPCMSLGVTGRLNNTRLQISIFLEQDRRRLTAGSYKSFRNIVDYERFVHNAYPSSGHDRTFLHVFGVSTAPSPWCVSRLLVRSRVARLRPTVMSWRPIAPR